MDTERRESMTAERRMRLDAEIKRRWPELTDEEVAQIRGDRAELAMALQRRYNYDRERADREAREFMDVWTPGTMAEVWTGESLRAGIPGRRYEAVTLEPSEQELESLKSDIRRNWDLTEREVERTCRDPDLLEEVLRDKYGYSRDRAREEVAACYDRVGLTLEESDVLRTGVPGRRYEAVRIEGTEADYGRLRQEIKDNWDISEPDLDKMCRDPELLEETLRTNYGYSRERAREEVARCYDRAGFMAVAPEQMETGTERMAGRRDMSTRTGPSLLSASALIGSGVRNPAGENLGKIEGLVFDTERGRVAFAVLSTGGMMGMGDRRLAVPWKAFSVGPGEHEVMLDVDRDRLMNAPMFDEQNMGMMSDTGWIRTVYEYYHVGDPWQD